MGLVWAMSIPALFVLLFVLAVLEVWGGKYLPWRRRSGRTAASVGTEEMVAFLYGTKRHELDQRQAEVMLVQSEDDGAPPRDRVDLESGKIVFKPKGA
ncbi:DUF6191 domain-containing protein [Amycolatopsis sp. NPDC058986]|uniref:DUF6191 domain-containing protein n=1 Tax=unclassified Amycolatopsis TaxID=2618356 RepID=UPI00366F8880